MGTDLSDKPDYVLKYFAHMDSSYAAELIRRRRVEAGERIERFFSAELIEAKEIAALGAGTWGKVVDFLLTRPVERKMRERRVTFADFATYAGLDPVILL